MKPPTFTTRLFHGKNSLTDYVNETGLRIGIDLGGTKIEGILIDAEGQELKRERRATPQGDYDETLDAIHLVAQSLSTNEAVPIGIGTPGSQSRVSPLMRNANSTCLNGKPLLDDLNNHLKRPVRMANDADCFTLSEATDGAAKNGSVVFGVILGTGVGGGISVNRTLVNGVNGISGEWGHNPVPFIEGMERGRECFCGRKDCIETWLAGPALTRTYREATGKELSAEKVSARAASGEQAAAQVMSKYLDTLAASLSLVINIIDPDTIVLGGGLSNIDQLYRELPGRLDDYVFSDHVATRIVQAEHGDSSGVRGAAWLW
ncbi:MAG: ROK family protein [Pseudomonadales bacterium]|nr:ROK family protein [Pseudomonadales bacterium]MBO6566244.1 ROK family protein [Pseudomonadales bacterium]MBO6594398.1 ROK family protein [Pseudomonadales bacterium]MBO6822041.1 ROK family protein [Pseudomonadales bacterium]